LLFRKEIEMAKKKMSSERKRELRALAEAMNRQNLVPVPITQALLECFDLIITSEEAGYLLKMGNELHTRGELAVLSDLDEGRFDSFLQRLLTRGLIESFFDEDGKEQFRLPGILPGWFENYLSDGKDNHESNEFARRALSYIESYSKYNVFPLRFILNRMPLVSKASTSIAIPLQSSEAKKTVTIDVDQAVDVPITKVYPTWDVLEILDRHGDSNDICVIHCFCRHSRRLTDEPCRFDVPSESCITVGEHAGYFARYGLGRLISKEEALEIIKQSEKKGVVHQLFYERHDMRRPEIAICNCCWDCCGTLGSYNRGILPTSVKSFYYSQISDVSLCDGCGVCERYCPVNAITMIAERARINQEICIGCGQCEIKCPRGVFRLHHRERVVFLPVQAKSKVRIASQEAN
jgi:ferredoxin